MRTSCGSVFPAVASLALAGLGGGATAQTGAPVIGPKPLFVPGLYETESRNSAFKDQGIKSRACIASADFDAFRRETIAQFLQAPQFTKACKLSETKPVADGFAFAMDCGGAKTIITYHFAKDLVSSTTQTLIVSRPEYSSTILTLSRRVGACSGGVKPDRGTDL